MPIEPSPALSETTRSEPTTSSLLPEGPRPFFLHPYLLRCLFERLAVNLASGILEAVMNAVNAGAREITIEIQTGEWPHCVSIRDNGCGFRDWRQIEEEFATFGAPPAGEAVLFGSFRLGRGKLLRFGRSRWRSNGWELEIDLAGRGLSYCLQESGSAQGGCEVTVELYEPLRVPEGAALRRELAFALAWLSVPVLLDGQLCSREPAGASWDQETEYAYFAFRPYQASLDVYNCGVLVNRFEARRFGTGGLVVTKQALGLNLARTDVLSACPVWRKVCSTLRSQAYSVTLANGRHRPSATEQDFLVEQILSGEALYEESCSWRLLTDVTGLDHPLESLGQAAAQTLVLATEGDRLGVAIQRARLALVLTPATLNRFGAGSLQRLLTLLGAYGARESIRSEPARAFHHALTDLTIKPLATFASIVPVILASGEEKNLAPALQRSLAAARAGAKRLAQILYECQVQEFLCETPLPDEACTRETAREATAVLFREVRAGQRGVAPCWADGRGLIWIEQGFLASWPASGYAGAQRLAALLLHEFLQSAAEAGRLFSGMAFYERYHRLATETPLLGAVADTILRRYRRGGRHERNQANVIQSNQRDVL